MSSLIQVEPDYVFITISKDWLYFYYKLLAAIAQHGVEELEVSRTIKCKDRSSSLSNCYNMFNAAIAARRLNKVKLANTIIKYIDAKIDLLYSDIDVPEVEETDYEYVYMDIPAEYIFTYYAMLKTLSYYGEEMLYDCKAGCGTNISKIIDYFNLFYTALIAKRNKNEEFAEKLINYVNTKLTSFLEHTIYLDFSFYADNDNFLEVFVFYEDGKVIYKIKEEDQDLYNEIFKSNTFPLIFDFTFGT